MDIIILCIFYYILFLQELSSAAFTEVAESTVWLGQTLEPRTFQVDGEYVSQYCVLDMFLEENYILEKCGGLWSIVNSCATTFI